MNSAWQQTHIETQRQSMINVNLERGGAQAENAGELEKDGSRFEMSNSNLRVNTLKRNKYKEF